MLEHRFRFGAEDEETVGNREVERVDAELISREEEFATLRVVNDEGKLAVETIQKRFAFILVEVQQHFDVAVGAKDVTASDKLLAQLEIVVDLAIAHQHNRIVFIEDGLIAAGKIDNAETAETECDVVIDKVSVGIGATMKERIGHTSQHMFIDASLAAHIQISGKAAHRLSGPPFLN